MNITVIINDILSYVSQYVSVMFVSGAIAAEQLIHEKWVWQEKRLPGREVAETEWLKRSCEFIRNIPSGKLT